MERLHMGKNKTGTAVFIGQHWDAWILKNGHGILEIFINIDTGIQGFLMA